VKYRVWLAKKYWEVALVYMPYRTGRKTKHQITAGSRTTSVSTASQRRNITHPLDIE
jgi:hypothetical protein